MKKLHLSKSNKMLVGVCGGFAEYLKVDAMLIRILVAIVGIVTSMVPIIVIAYIVCWAILPAE